MGVYPAQRNELVGEHVVEEFGLIRGRTRVRCALHSYVAKYHKEGKEQL